MGYKIAMVSDFFYPRLGGVENHILNLSKELRTLGHTIIIITHANTGVKGVRYVEGFKTYYLELLSIFSGAVFPTFLGTVFPVGRILFEEGVEIVHGHQCSTLAIEGVFHGKMLGLSTCFTNHSLVRVNTLGGLLTYSAIRMSLVDVDQIVCVSQAGKNNTAERLDFSHKKMEVISNAVTEEFYPEFTRNTEEEIVISVVSRLTFRKGAVLLADVLPMICRIDHRIKVVIAGEGDRKEYLEQVVELNNLKERVTFLGGVHPKEVKNVLNKSDLFLNTSLTDAFCISIIEAAACGLYVVSTNVDGIGEVLPEEMITLTPTTPEGIVKGIKEALPKIRQYNKILSHKKVTSIYKWSNVAKETDQVYRKIYRDKRKIGKTKYEITTKSVKKMLLYRKDKFYLPFMIFFLFNYLLIMLLIKRCRSSSVK